MNENQYCADNILEIVSDNFKYDEALKYKLTLGEINEKTGLVTSRQSGAKWSAVVSNGGANILKIQPPSSIPLLHQKYKCVRRQYEES